MKEYASLLARILLSAVFLVAGMNKIMNPVGTQQYMTAYKMPFTSLFWIGAVVFEVAGGLSILFGFKARWGALALFMFLIPATLIFHTDFSDPNQIGIFLKNLAIMGGLLMVANSGPESLSVDRR